MDAREKMPRNGISLPDASPLVLTFICNKFHPSYFPLATFEFFKAQQRPTNVLLDFSEQFSAVRELVLGLGQKDSHHLWQRQNQKQPITLEHLGLSSIIND